MNLIKTNKEGWAKDLDSGAILSVDNNQLNAYKKQKQIAQENLEARQKISDLQKEINDIKNLLVKILESKQ